MKDLYMEFIDIRSGNGVETNIGAAFSTDKETLANFTRHKRLEVDRDDCEFLLDLYSDNGDNLEDTILVDSDGFRTITGEEPKAEWSY